MGTIVAGIATVLILIAILLSPKLARMGIHPFARYSFATLMITLAIYLGWVAGLLYGDLLGPNNYTFELWLIRTIALLASLHFLYAVYKCDK